MSGINAVAFILEQQEDIRIRITVLLWCWWSARNKANQGKRMSTTTELHSSVLYHCAEMMKLQKKGGVTSRSATAKWQAPGEDMYKINCNGAFVKETMQGGWGCVIRDHHGEFLAACASHLGPLSGALRVEAFACLKDLELAASLGMTQVIMETDAVNLLQAITADRLDRSLLGALFTEIREKM